MNNLAVDSALSIKTCACFVFIRGNGCDCLLGWSPLRNFAPDDGICTTLYLLVNYVIHRFMPRF